MKLKISNFAEIHPNESLGGINLRIKIKELKGLILPFKKTKKEFGNLSPPYIDAKYIQVYSVDDLPIQVSVDSRNKKIFRITAYEGYKGHLFSEITVGMKVIKAFDMIPDLYYDEPEEVILCRGVDGISLSLPLVDPDPDIVPHMDIFAISVFANETCSLKGQKGTW